MPVSHDFKRRRRRLFEALPDRIEAAFLPPSPTLTYFTGLHMHQSERPTVVMLFRDDEPAVVLPELEADRVRDALGTETTFYTYADATDPVDAARAAFDQLQEEQDLSGQIAAEYRSTRLLEYELLADEHEWEDVFDLGRAAGQLRATKDEAEIETMREAAEITDRILGETLDELEAGMREVDIEAAIRKRVIDSEADEYGVGIVTSGERTAHAHANTGTRTVSEGDLVMIDMGVVHRGYYSDITRTVAVGEPESELYDVYDTVREAARQARERVAEGVAYQELDRAARTVIEDAGYGDAFPHRVGHGLGLEGHEPPYLVEGNEATLEPGNVFTIEPGIYLDGLGGVRIEDDVALTEDGPEVLTKSPRELRTI